MKFTPLLLAVSLIAGKAFTKQCAFKQLGYNCCKTTTEVISSDKYGNWGKENGKRCGIVDDSCWSLKYGSLCCTSTTTVRKSDSLGKWGKENGRWCGIKSASQSTTLNSLMFDDGGSGPFKAVMTEEDGLPDFTIYRPKDLNAAVKAQGSLPVILFGNGGCGHISLTYSNFLTEIASHGYVIAAIGEWVSEDNTDYSSMSLDFGPEVIAANRKDAEDLVDVALAYLDKENKDKSSIFYKTMKTNHVVAMGQSCGGLQALIISAKNDERIKTTVALNSGANNPDDLLGDLFLKEDLKNLTKPIIYIIGGEEDIAHNNALDDFSLIDNVPVALACKSDAGHMGTYSEPNGGTFGKMTLAWLDFIMKKDKNKKNIFRKNEIPEELEGWTVEHKNF